MPVCDKRCHTCGGAMRRVHSGSRYCSLDCYFDFHTKIDKSQNGCWTWHGVKNTAGYGRMTRGRQNYVPAHRFSYQRYIGSIPRGLHVLHKCDNPSCVRPDHLFVGSDKDNALDKIAKKRYGNVSRLGEMNTFAKLSERDVLKIRASQEPSSLLARKFRIDRQTVWKIRTRKAWKHLP